METLRSYELGRRQRQRRWKPWLAALLAVGLLAGYGAWSLKRPLPALTPVSSGPVQATVPSGKLNWPGGEAAVGIAGTPLLEKHGQQTGLPTASTAKLITALCVLRQKPLAAGQQGPSITMSANDVALFNSYNAQQGSVVPVVAGEQITEYQALQAVLLPSANNLADSLAIWAFGSLKNYQTYANNYLSQMGLRDTHVGSDASGLAPTTVSSAQDLVRLGELAMENPVLAGIVGQPSASGIPVAGNIKNVNFLLGTSGIVGVKTGNTDQAGGVFVGAAKTKVNGRTVTLVTAVSGSSSLFAAMKESLILIQSAQANFKPVTVATSATVVGNYRLPWGGSVAAVTESDLKLSGWAGSRVSAKPQLHKIPTEQAATGRIAGSLVVPGSALNPSERVTVKLQSSAPLPSAWWRLSHPLR